MLGFTHYITRNKTMLLAIALLMGVVNYSNAQEASEHIHAADAVMEQSFTKDVKTNSASYVISTHNKSLEFVLETNSRLLGDSFALSDNVSIYRGKLSGAKNSWARFTRVDGIMEGAFFDGNELFLVKGYAKLASILDRNALNYQESVRAESDENTSLVINVKDIDNTGTCGLHDDQINSDMFKAQESKNSFNYDVYVDDLRVMLDSQLGKEIQISLFADTEFSSSSNNAVAEMISLLNVADGIFSEQIGVQFKLTDAKALNSNGTLTSSNPESLVIAFRQSGLENPGVSHLFTNKNLNGSTVGIAYVGSLCRQSSVGLTQRLGSKTSLIFTHELGHNFGAPHDNQSGSACRSTPSGFVMNPNINSGGNEFSACSKEQMEPVIDYAMNGYQACVADVSILTPNITSVANLDASIGSAYLYDSDGVVEADGTGPFTYSLDIAPAGMTISQAGKISWLPTISNVGSNTVQIRVSNAVGSDIQTFELPIESQATDTFINFEDRKSTSYDDQDKTQSFSVGDTPQELELTGNTWRSIPFDYKVTENTVIQFDFTSNAEGEIHGISFDNNNKLSPETTFQVYGTQPWGIEDYSYSRSGSAQTFTIPVGEHFTGNFDRLVFIMDNDESPINANSVFSKVIVFEDDGSRAPKAPVISIDALEVTSHMPGYQDFSNNVEFIEQGNGIRLEGNSWKKVVLDSTKITPTTVLTFDFKSDNISEIHGLGFFTGDVISEERTIQISGTQDYGIRDFTYTTKGEWQSFSIPIGEYFTTNKVELVFILDNDENLQSDSSFSNITFSTE